MIILILVEKLFSCTNLNNYGVQMQNKLRFFHLTKCGKKTDVNEDNIAIPTWDPEQIEKCNIIENKGFLFVLCDGMGGHLAGNIASYYCSNWMLTDFYNEEIDGQINMAISPRQPGSSIKPITYVTSFEKGWTPATLIWDVETEFPPSGNPNDPRDPYIPTNYDNRFHGPVTVRSALANELGCKRL